MNEEKKTQGRRTFEVREETIFDYLMHAATWEDIASLRLEVKEDIGKLDAKIDRVASYLDSKIDKVSENLDAKIDKVAGNLDSKIDRVEERITKKVDSHFKWLTGFLIVAVIAPFVANLIT